MTLFRAIPAFALLVLTLTACGNPGLPDAAERDASPSADLSPATAPRGACIPVGAGHYQRLSETCLYDDVTSGELAPGVEPFEPNFKLWSDGAEKRRFVALPAGASVDTTDMDHWQFPVGTRFWKEFWVNGVRVETRMIERTGPGPDDYFMGAFVWNEDQTDAVLQTEGQPNVNGTAHDVPSQAACHTCHDGEPGRVLGFSALQLSRKAGGLPGIDLADLLAKNALSAPPPAADAYAPPGDTTTQAALGYLHANCGHCHNPVGSCAESGLFFRLMVGDRSVEGTATFGTAVAQPTRYAGGAVPAALRIAPGAPSDSAVIQRMQTLGNERMPYLGTEVVDETGVATLSAWIASLSP